MSTSWCRPPSPHGPRRSRRPPPRPSLLLLPSALLGALGCSAGPELDHTSAQASAVRIADSCVPLPGAPGAGQPPIFRSCDDAFRQGRGDGCYRIGTSTDSVTQQCDVRHVLVMQLDNDGDLIAPAPDRAYLDSVLDKLRTMASASSYGRVVLDVEVAGDKALPSEQRWFISAAPIRVGFHDPDRLEEAHCHGQLLRAVDDYDLIATFATSPGIGNANTDLVSLDLDCDAATADQTFAAPVNLVRGYRGVSDTSFGRLASHELFHVVGAEPHDQGLSSASGRDAARTALNGQIEEYGGRSSVMATGNGASLNLRERIRGGWLNGGVARGGRHVAEAVAGGPTSFTIGTLETDVDELKGVFVPFGVGNDGYWIESRRDADLDERLKSGLILHIAELASFEDKVPMLDGTPETPADSLGDGALPLGRTYADAARRIYITAVGQSATSATVEVQVSPVNPNAPVITSITATDCNLPLAGCKPGLSTSTHRWRFSAVASDPDGDALSYAWRLELGSDGQSTTSSFASGATIYREMPAPAIGPRRLLLTVSDRKGREASATLDWPSQATYRAAWSAPGVTRLRALPLDSKDKRQGDNEFRLSAVTTSSEALDLQWVVGSDYLPWKTPIVSVPSYPTTRDAAGQPCLSATVIATDTLNCNDEPISCALAYNTCVSLPLALAAARRNQPWPLTGQRYQVSMLLDAAALLPSGDGFSTSWSTECLGGLTPASDGLSAWLPLPAATCAVKLELHADSGPIYKATIDVTP